MAGTKTITLPNGSDVTCELGAREVLRHGDHEPLYLPDDIRGLGDDPYRSLVWMVEQENGIRDTREPYAEFAWAQFLRKRKLLSPAGREHLDHALKKALAVCRARQARHLPGYRPPK